MSALGGYLALAALLRPQRIRLVVEVNLDPVPGWGNDAEDYRALTQRLLDDSIPHYHPTVTIEATS